MNAPATASAAAAPYPFARGRVAEPDELAWWLRDARARLLEVAGGLTARQLIGPYRATVNPILWAMGHVAFFQERWAWQHHFGGVPLRPEAELLYDSFEVDHPDRWQLPLLGLSETRVYLDEVLERLLDRIAKTEPSQAATYFHRLAVFHEDMHAEAIAYDRNTLAYPAPPLHAAADGAGTCAAGEEIGGPWPGDAEIPGCNAFPLGAPPDRPYVWDNEKWAHPVAVRPFRIAKAPVTCGEFAAFVEAGGYREERFWSPAAWRWLKRQALEHPAAWHRAAGGGWRVRRYDQWVPLPEHHPVTPVAWHEAQAFCAWAGRRLPTEAEWEMAAASAPGDCLAGGVPARQRYPWGAEPATPERANLDAARAGTLPVDALPAGDSAWGCRQMAGNVWEWTADAFYPFPGFIADPYREYSAPWFGYSKVLKGGAWLTRGRLVHTGWRNFYLPTRMDLPAGFRTCAR
ncbi:MAG: selenoneine synthase SenA [SAR324 cluster bacterium]